MLLKIHEKGDSHYFIVMGWKDKEPRKNAPKYNRRFNSYEDAAEYFDRLSERCSFVELSEYIGGKRKWIADTEDTSNL